MELVIYNHLGNSTNRTIHLDDEIFSVEPNFHTIYLDVKLKLANLHRGTHQTKGKSEVSGSTKKIKKQKGTGGARAGSIKSPLFPGGATVFGPVVRDYGFKLNKKVIRLARRSALSIKFANNKGILVEDFKWDAPKTASFISFVKAFKKENEKILLITTDNDRCINFSARNIPNATVIEATSVSTYDLMKAATVFIFESAVPKIETFFK